MREIPRNCPPGLSRGGGRRRGGGVAQVRALVQVNNVGTRDPHRRPDGVLSDRPGVGGKKHQTKRLTLK